MRFTPITISLLVSIAAGTDTVNKLDTWFNNLGKQRKCYHDLGCFDLQNPWFTWSRPIPVLPQPAEVIDTKFFLLTRENPYFPQLLRTRPFVDISSSFFKKSHNLFYVVHGYISHYNDEWALSLAKQLLILFDANVILVDWANGANTINYIQAVANARLVGAEMARLTSELTLQGLSEPAKIHGLGYSLGAQVIGYMANNITGIQRITALDPAQPGFEDTDPVVHLEASDAQFVDVIHTNGAPFFPDLGLGFRDSVGHVDFFVNGGEIQPECRNKGDKVKPELKKEDVYELVENYLHNYPKLNVRVDSAEELQAVVGELSDEDTVLETHLVVSSYSILGFLIGTLTYLVNYVMCSHTKAPQYFLESLELRNCSFWGVPWLPYEYPLESTNCTFEICSEMGLHSIVYPARGNFYVKAETKPPFCDWKPKIEVLMKNSLADELLRRNENKCES